MIPKKYTPEQRQQVIKAADKVMMNHANDWHKYPAAGQKNVIRSLNNATRLMLHAKGLR